MSIGAKEKMLIHIYKDAARLGEMEYRRILAAESGCDSSADREFEAVHFRHVMARIEAVLWNRVADGTVPRPMGGRYVQSETYWRDQAKRTETPGRMTSGQMARINDLLARLRGPMGAAYTADYIAGIFRRAIGRAVHNLTDLSSADASRVIDALQDKLSAAVRSQKSEVIA